MPHVRVTATSQVKKAIRQYEELRARGDLKHAVIIAELKDGNYHVLAQGMDLREIGYALIAATEGVAHAAGVEHERAKGFKLGDPAPEEGPPPRNSSDWGRKRVPEIQKDPEGALVPPAGEAFIVCGECGASRWFVTQLEGQRAAGEIARMACTSCGNELKMLRHLSHPGRA